MRKVFLHSLGCSKNTVDSERLMAQAAASGTIFTDMPDDAEIILINIVTEQTIQPAAQGLVVIRRSSINHYRHIQCIVTTAVVRCTGVGKQRVRDGRLVLDTVVVRGERVRGIAEINYYRHQVVYSYCHLLSGFLPSKACGDYLGLVDARRENGSVVVPPVPHLRV